MTEHICRCMHCGQTISQEPVVQYTMISPKLLELHNEISEELARITRVLIVDGSNNDDN